MPNQNNFNQQSNTSSANDNSSISSGGGIMGYTSPYSSQAQPPYTQLTPATQTQQVAPQAQNIAQPQNSQSSTQANSEEMDLQSYMNTSNQAVQSNNPQTVQTTTQNQVSPGAEKSDNLLDDPSQVHEILTNGEVTKPEDQPVQINQLQQNQTAQVPAQIVNTIPQQNQQIPQASQNQVKQLNNQPLNINQGDIPEFLQNPQQMQQNVQAQLHKEKEALELAQKKAKELADEQERKAREIEIAKRNAFQAPLQKNKPVFTNDRPRQSQQLNPDKDLASAPAKTSNVSGKKFANIAELLDLVISQNASDLHLTVGYAPHIRIDDKLLPVGASLNREEVRTFISQSLTQNQKELLEVNREVDLSYQHKNAGRFRINAYYERGNMAAAYRLIPQRIKTTTELGLPNTLLDFTKLSQGLFLITGPTGSGKSTTLAGMLQYINSTEQKHIITVEDPIEYVYPVGEALIDQRELGSDTHDWSIALKSALRQDPDVILIGELRDFETIQAAITLAETGHLVFATLHTNSAAQSIDRIIDVFPPHQQQQIRTQLAGALKGILSQRLVPLIGGGRQAVIELLIVTPAVQNLIREGKTYQMDNVVATSADLGMISLEKSLVKLVRDGKITAGTAQDYAIRPEEILKLMKNGY